MQVYPGTLPLFLLVQLGSAIWALRLAYLDVARLLFLGPESSPHGLDDETNALRIPAASLVELSRPCSSDYLGTELVW